MAEEDKALKESLGSLANHNERRRQSKESSGRRESGLLFQHGRRGSNAQTLGEVNHLLQRPEARTGPPCTAASFKAGLLKKFHKLEYAWKEIDTNCDGVLQFHEFVAACRRIEFVGNLQRIFDELTSGQDVLTPEMLDPGLPAQLAKHRDRTQSKESSRSRSQSKESSGRRESGLLFQHGRRGSNAQTLGEVHLLLQRPDAKEGPPSDARAFKSALVKKYGRLELAWEEIDENGDGALQFQEFVRACRRIQFVGNLRKIFDELAPGGSLMPEALGHRLPVQPEKLRVVKFDDGISDGQPLSETRPVFRQGRRASEPGSESPGLL